MPESSPSFAQRGAGNFVKLVSGQIAVLVLMTVSGFVIPRLFGAESYGRYAAVMAVVAILRAASSLGLQQIGLRYLGPLWHSDERPKAIELASSLWTARTALSFIVGGLATAASGVQRVQFGIGQRHQVKITRDRELRHRGQTQAAHDKTRIDGAVF